MRASELVKYYSQQEFRDFLLKFSRNREIIPRFNNYFGERPQTFRFDGELINTIRKGVSSFHFSEERWVNPMALSTEMKNDELNKLRSNWDLVFDVDCPVFEYSRICTKLIVDALDIHDLSKPSIKFSGGTGFHVGLSFNKPERIKGQLVKNLFPKAPRIIGSYIQAMIKDYLKETLLEMDDLSVISDKLGQESQELLGDDDEFNPFKVVNIDPIAIAPRHLIRSPYSLNEKQWLVSLPIRKKDLMSFEREMASPDKINFEVGFLDEEFDASELFIHSFDWYEREQSLKKDSVKREFKRELPSKAIVDEYFPPCIKGILKGLTDGRKRSLFILTNFLHKCGYDWSLIKERLSDWNNRNESPLKSNYITAQVDWSRRQGGLMPQNCSNPNYKDIGVCHPDNLCSKIKNPVTYATRKNKAMSKGKKRRRKS